MRLRKLGRYYHYTVQSRTSVLYLPFQGAAKLPEFTIRINKDDDSDIFIVLNVMFPKAYPTKSIPILSITQAKGLTSVQVNKILSAIHAEAQRLLGSESIFSVGPYSFHCIFMHGDYYVIRLSKLRKNGWERLLRNLRYERRNRVVYHLPLKCRSALLKKRG